MPEGPLNGRPIGVQIKLRNPNPAAGPLSEAEQAELAIVERLEKCNTDRLGPSASQPEVMVKRTRRALTRGSTDGRKALCPRAGSTCLDVRVSKQSLDRVLGILDHVMTILRAEGFSLVVSGNVCKSTSVRILDKDIRFGLLEKIRTIPPPGTPTKSAKQFTSIFDRLALEYEPSSERYFQVWNDCQNVRAGATENTRNSNRCSTSLSPGWCVLRKRKGMKLSNAARKPSGSD